MLHLRLFHVTWILYYCSRQILHIDLLISVDFYKLLFEFDQNLPIQVCPKLRDERKSNNETDTPKVTLAADQREGDNPNSCILQISVEISTPHPVVSCHAILI